MSCLVTLKKGEGRFLKNGGMWIYDNEIDKMEGDFENGEVVSVFDFDGYPMGKGVINLNSVIRIRMLTRDVNVSVDREFFAKRVKDAWEYRKCVMNAKDLRAARLVFGEADRLPGIVIDRYEDVLVIECLSLGMDAFKEIIVDELKKILEKDGIIIKGVFERSDANVIKKEGLNPHKGFIGAEFDTDVEIEENGVRYLIDVKNGQKTGFFLDQKYNRLAMQNIVKNMHDAGMKVDALDCFTHMGTFALNCGLGGADSCLGLDISEFAVEQAERNAKLNGLSDRVKFRCANVLDELPGLYEEGKRYDVLILDPPAFTKSRTATKNAIKGYREINIKGLKLVRDGGIFATCSCSHFMTEDLFKTTILQAAKSAHKRLRQIEFRTQSKDHPIMMNVDESYYLKFFIFQVCDER
ncbi:MAG: class I SAM-dependent rRNA methyltransferase [Lachnospiraceae bacterium]|nr:class I SAM-dependent rRNA methyltransferase [Lachnospiraceae bacterium]